jgi:arabinoxylan arabinofuranohydrolase
MQRNKKSSLAMVLLGLLGLIVISGCADRDFVGGVVVGNDKAITLLEIHSQTYIDIEPNPQGVTEFQIDDIIQGAQFDFTVVDNENCSIVDNVGEYDGFPNFGVKVQCEDGNGQRWSGNPVLRNQYTADPTLLVVEDYLYLYAGRDETSFIHMQKSQCKNRCLTEALQTAANFDITGIHIYRTKNMVDWEYVGPAVEAKDVSWMRQTWASHILAKNGKYYLFTCSPAKDIITDVGVKSIISLLSGGGIAIGPSALTGVAVSDSPAGPFIDSGAPLVSYLTPGAIDEVMDPAAFTDDDGTTYLFFGGGGNAQYVALSDDLLSINGPIREIEGVDGSDPMPELTEATYVHKRKGIYYLSYSKSKVGEAPSPLAYATAGNIHGPWTYQGDMLGAVDILTNHGAITTYKGKDYLFYHTGQLPGIHSGALSSNATRAVSVQELKYNDVGQIIFTEQTALGVSELLVVE